MNACSGKEDAGWGVGLWEECYQEAAAAYSMLANSSARTPGCHKAVTMSAVDVCEVMAAGVLGLLGDGEYSPSTVVVVEGFDEGAIAWSRRGSSKNCTT